MGWQLLSEIRYKLLITYDTWGGIFQSTKTKVKVTSTTWLIEVKNTKPRYSFYFHTSSLMKKKIILIFKVNVTTCSENIIAYRNLFLDNITYIIEMKNSLQISTSLCCGILVVRAFGLQVRGPGSTLIPALHQTDVRHAR